MGFIEKAKSVLMNKENSKTQNNPSFVDQTKVKDNSVTGFEEDVEFLEKHQSAYEQKMKLYEEVPDLTPTRVKFEDVLEVLDIPVTFELSENIFMPEDLEKPPLKKDASHGSYNTQNVEAFLQQTKETVSFYFEKLTERNVHVAKLATVVDKLQVDIANLKFDKELEAGISIIASNEESDLENKYLEAMLNVRRLEDELKAVKGDTSLYNAERDELRMLKEKFFILQRESSEKDEEILNLQSKIMEFEEYIESEPNSVYEVEEEAEEFVLPDIEETDEVFQTPEERFSTVKNQEVEVNNEPEVEVKEEVLVKPKLNLPKRLVITDGDTKQ